MRNVKYFLIPLMIVSFTFLNAKGNDEILELVAKYKKSKLLKNAQWSLYAEYLETGKVILDNNSTTSVAPASGLKVFTTLTALDVLGENYTYKTGIYYEGELLNGVLDGNIIIKGDGDPSLGSWQVEGARKTEEVLAFIVNEIKNAGIKKINGAVIADNSKYEFQPIPDNWEYIDIGNYYGASSSALSLNENTYFLYFSPGKKVGEPAEVLRTEPIIKGLSFNNMMTTGEKGSGDNGYIYCPPMHYNAYLKGSIPFGVKEFSIKGSIPDPPLFAAQSLTDKLIEAGVSVSDEPLKSQEKIDFNQTEFISELISPPLKNIIFILNKRSSNLFAEMVLKEAAYKSKGEGATNTGVKVVEEYLKRENINTEGLNLYDGSGLSRANMISAKIMVKLLANATKKSYFNAFFNSLGIFGEPGDIGYFSNTGIGTALEKNAHVKSGVIQGVRSYSGYLKDRNGKTIVFSLIANNFDGSGGRVSEIHREIMTALANLK